LAVRWISITEGVLAREGTIEGGEIGCHMVKPHYGIRSDRHKLIHYYTIDEWELFDLSQDPDEMNSVYSRPDYLDLVSFLKTELDSTRIAEGDTVGLSAASGHFR
jgi:hypothetical protein